MRRTDINDSDNTRGRSGGRRRPSFGEAVGPGFVPDLGPEEDRDDRDRPRRRGGRGHGFGPGSGRRGGPWGGHGGPAFGGPRGPRGRRGRPRGDVRAAILLLLEEGPRHGYQLIQEIGERSNGIWTPSAGSVYPTLQALEDEGLVTIEPVDGRKTASLTEAGGTYVAEHRDQLGTPWEQSDADGEIHALRDAMIGLAEASKQVFRVGTADQQRRASATLVEARTALYRILAEDGTES